jgi:hypothetical protein
MIIFCTVLELHFKEVINITILRSRPKDLILLFHQSIALIATIKAGIILQVAIPTKAIT